MKKITKNYKRLKIQEVKIAVLAIITFIFFMPGYTNIENTGNNMFTVLLNGTYVGTVGDSSKAEEYLKMARRATAGDGEELVLIDSNLECMGEEVFWGHIDDEETVVANMVQVLKDNVKQTLHRSYTVKVNDYTVNLASKEEVLELLRSSIRKYDMEGEYDVELVLDGTRELNVLTTNILSRKEQQEQEGDMEVLASAGIFQALDEMFDDIEPAVEKDFSDYELGLISLEFGDEIEVVESYLAEEELTPVEEAINEVTKDQEKNQIYEIQAGDSLSKIAVENELTIEKLIEMNESIEDENLSLIHI